MKKKQRKTQLVLISIGFLLILLTYIYPHLNKDKLQDNQSIQKDLEKPQNDAQSTSFEDVEYEGLTATMQKFSVKSESAYILDEDPDLVFMKTMMVKVYLNNHIMMWGEIKVAL